MDRETGAQSYLSVTEQHPGPLNSWRGFFPLSLALGFQCSPPPVVPEVRRLDQLEASHSLLQMSYVLHTQKRLSLSLCFPGGVQGVKSGVVWLVFSFLCLIWWSFGFSVFCKQSWAAGIR